MYFSSNVLSTHDCRLNGLSFQNKTRWHPLELNIETQEITSGMELLQLTMKRNCRKETSSFCSREQRLLKDSTGSTFTACNSETSLCAENTAIHPVSSTTQVPLNAVWKNLYSPTTAKAEVLQLHIHDYFYLSISNTRIDFSRRS